MKKIILLILVITQTSIGGFERAEIGARPTALGNTYVGLSNDVWGIHYNPAGLTSLSRFQISTYYSPQPFGFSELSLVSIAASVPTKIGTLGLSVMKYGFSLYHEFTGTISFARSLSGIHLGLNLNYNSVVIKNYGSSGTFGIDIGVLIPLHTTISLGAVMKNINSATIGIKKDKLPQSFTTGIAYQPFTNLSVLLDLQKEISFDVSKRFGFEYWIGDIVALRGGVADEPTQYTGGIGFRYFMFQLDYAYSVHQELGWTHSFSITIQ